MNDKIESTINVLPPFKRMCMTIGELPASYLETMTYYETLLWLIKYLQETVIPTINNNALAVAELQELFKKLQDYVNTYFDNLDVQEEINNKLDEMAEDGSLANIIEKKLINDICYMHKVGILPYEHSTDFYNMQGGCLGKNDDEFIQYQIKGNSSNNRLSVISLETGQTLRSNTLQLGHGNGVTYHDDKIYVTGGANDEYSNNIYIIDYDTLTIIDTITNTSYYGLTWSDNDNCFYAMNYWSYLNSKTLYKLDENLTLISSKTFNFNIGKSTANIGCIGEYIGVISLDPTNIILFDSDMEYVKSITLERNIDFMHFASEVEWVNGKDTKNVYLGIRLFGAPGINGGNHLIAKTSLINSYPGGSPTISSVTNEFTATIRVSNENNWHWYEDGSASLPYNNPYLASNMAQIQELKRLYVNLGVEPTSPISAITLPYTYNFELQFNNCNPVIYLRSGNDRLENNERIYFEGALLVRNSIVDINNVQFGSNIEDDYKFTAIDFSTITIRRNNHGSDTKLFNIDRNSTIIGDANNGIGTLENSHIYGKLLFNRYKSSINGYAYLSNSIPENTDIAYVDNITTSFNPAGNDVYVAIPKKDNIGVLLTCKVTYNSTDIGFYFTTTFSPGHRSGMIIPIGSNLMCKLDVTNIDNSSDIWNVSKFSVSVTNLETNETVSGAIINYLRFTL